MAGLHARRERALHLRPDRVGAGLLLLRGAGHVWTGADERAGGQRGCARRQPAWRRAVVPRRHRFPARAGIAPSSDHDRKDPVAMYLVMAFPSPFAYCSATLR